MTAAQILYMLLICGILWGGFAACLVYLWRVDKEDGSDP